MTFRINDVTAEFVCKNSATATATRSSPAAGCGLHPQLRHSKCHSIRITAEESPQKDRSRRIAAEGSQQKDHSRILLAIIILTRILGCAVAPHPPPPYPPPHPSRSQRKFDLNEVYCNFNSKEKTSIVN